MKILVVRGTEGCLHDHGLEHMEEEADLVIPVEHVERVVDRYGQVNDVSYISVDAPEQVVGECLERIKLAWEQRFPAESHLGHAAAGMWWFYWVSPSMESMAKLAADGRSEDLRAAAKDFVDAGCGEERGPSLIHDHEPAR